MRPPGFEPGAGCFEGASETYAENGSGKTTIAAILRSLATGDALPITERHRLAAPQPPHVVIDCSDAPLAIFENGSWTRALPEIAISDDSGISSF